MATKKRKSLKLPRKPGFTLNMDPLVLKALDGYAFEMRKKRAIAIQDIVLEHLAAKGHWPPKAEEGK